MLINNNLDREHSMSFITNDSRADTMTYNDFRSNMISIDNSDTQSIRTKNDFDIFECM